MERYFPNNQNTTNRNLHKIHFPYFLLGLASSGTSSLLLDGLLLSVLSLFERVRMKSINCRKN